MQSRSSIWQVVIAVNGLIDAQDDVASRLKERIYFVRAKSSGGAFREAVRLATRSGHLKRQPRSTVDGSWEGVAISRRDDLVLEKPSLQRQRLANEAFAGAQ